MSGQLGWGGHRGRSAPLPPSCGRCNCIPTPPPQKNRTLPPKPKEVPAQRGQVTPKENFLLQNGAGVGRGLEGGGRPINVGGGEAGRGGLSRWKKGAGTWEASRQRRCGAQHGAGLGGKRGGGRHPPRLPPPSALTNSCPAWSGGVAPGRLFGGRGERKRAGRAHLLSARPPQSALEAPTVRKGWGPRLGGGGCEEGAGPGGGWKAGQEGEGFLQGDRRLLDGVPPPDLPPTPLLYLGLLAFQ